VGLWVGLPVIAKIWTCSLFVSMHMQKKKNKKRREEDKTIELREGRVGTKREEKKTKL